MDQLQDRQDALIWNAIEAGNYKQAVKLVDKRLAKKPSDYLEALRIYIRSFSSSISEKSAVLLALEELAEKKRPITELSTITLYDDAFEQVFRSVSKDWARIIGEVRWQAVKANPKNEDLSLQCFQTCLGQKDLDHARQIANSLEKNFPSNRAYIFWNIALMFLFSTSDAYPASETKIWGSLAFAQISKLAATTRQSAPGSQLPARSIQGPQELLLLHLISETYGKTEQQLDYLKDPQLGPESSVSKGEWEIWRMKLRMMQDAEQWNEVFAITNNFLERARTKDASGVLSEAQLNDWVVWQAFIRSAVEADDPIYKSKVRNEIEAQLSPVSGIDKSWRRNASLALIQLTFNDHSCFSATDFEETSQISLRVTVIFEYLTNYGGANTAYNDVKPFVENLKAGERGQLLSLLRTGSDDVSTAKAISNTVNKHKLIYLVTCGLPEAERFSSPNKSNFKCSNCAEPCGKDCENCLNNFAKEALALYQAALDDKGEVTQNLLTTDRHPADDLCVISAICLIKLGLIGEIQNFEPLANRKSQYWLQAAAILEKAWLRSKSNFQISLLLIRLYSFLGCGSLAMRAYQRLALKQIQLDTLSYTLFDRISTVHPRAFTSHTPEGGNKTPLQQLQRQQQVYDDAYRQVAKNMWLSFKHGSYNSMYHIKNVEKELSHGLGAAMSVIERRRISRLTEPETPLTAVSHGWDLLAPNAEVPGVLSADNNDYKSYPNYESTLSLSFEELTRIAPAPSAYRYRTNLFAEKLFLIISPSTPSGEYSQLQQWLKTYLASSNPDIFPNTPAQMGDKTQRTKDAMTRAEGLARRVHLAIALIIDEAGGDEGHDSRLKGYHKDLSDALEENILLVDDLKGAVPAYFDTLHTLYTSYEVGKVVLSFTAYLTKRSKIAQVEAIEEGGKGLLQAVEMRCGEVKKGMDEGWIDKVLECVFSEGALLSEDDDFIEEWAGEVVESWRESVVGLAALKA